MVKIKCSRTGFCRFAVLFICTAAAVTTVMAGSAPAPMESENVPPPPPGETVTINGILYPVPRAWVGRKLNSPPPAPSTLVRIPQQLTEDQSKIYIVKEARDALVVMAARAEEDGVLLRVDSGYRSARYQKQIFIRLMKKGRTFEDLVRYVAPPGYSEHMLGTVVDFSPGNWRFAATSAYAWLHEHAGEFGFSESYPKNNRYHPWESWHWRYRKPPSPADR